MHASYFLVKHVLGITGWLANCIMRMDCEIAESGEHFLQVSTALSKLQYADGFELQK